MQNTKKISVKDILLMGMGESVAPKKVAKTPKARPCDVAMLAESYAYIMSDVEKRKYQVLAMSHYSTVKLATGEDAKAILEKVKKAGSKVKEIVINLLKALGRFLRESYNFIMGKIRAAKTVVKDAISKLKNLRSKKVELPNYDKKILKQVETWAEMCDGFDLEPLKDEEIVDRLTEMEKSLSKMSGVVLDAQTAPTTQAAEDAIKYFEEMERANTMHMGVVANTIAKYAKIIDEIRKKVQADKDAQNPQLTKARGILPAITKKFNEARAGAGNLISRLTMSFKFKEVKEK